MKRDTIVYSLSLRDLVRRHASGNPLSAGATDLGARHLDTLKKLPHGYCPCPGSLEDTSLSSSIPPSPELSNGALSRAMRDFDGVDVAAHYDVFQSHFLGTH
jgi:hypothetical protein